MRCTSVIVAVGFSVFVGWAAGVRADGIIETVTPLLPGDKTMHLNGL